MKMFRHGMVLVCAMYIVLSLLSGCVHFHPIYYLDEPCIKPYHGYQYRTCAMIDFKIDGKHFYVPKNFKTDLASIPRVLWPIIPPQYSKFVAPAILHDYLYRYDTNTSRKFADEVFYSALITEDVDAFTAMKFYFAVRIFGGSHFGKNNEES